MGMFKRETIIAIISLVVIVIASYMANWQGVDIDCDTIAMVAVTAIAALVRGDSRERAIPEPIK